MGALGEELAARWLRRSGARLIGRNLRAPEGELDLIALLDGALVVVEVKAGWSPARWAQRTSWRPAMRVRAEELSPRIKAARRIGGRTGRPGRVDVVEVWALQGERRARLRRWEDVRAVDALASERRSIGAGLKK